MASLPAAPATAQTANEIERARELARVGDVEPIRRLIAEGRLAPATRHLLEARLHAVELKDGEAVAALNRYFAAGDSDPLRLREAHEIGAGTAFAAGRYADAARHGAEVLARPAGLAASQLDDMQRLTELARILAVAPPQRLEGKTAGSTATSRDKVGLARTKLASGGATEETVIDTGANLSVASASAAKRMGLRMLEGASAVGNSVGGAADVKVGIADKVEVAGATLRNVVFLVLDDAALEFPVSGGYRIDTITGFPVLRALGRLTFGPGDTLTVGAAPAVDAKGSALRMVVNQPYVMARLGAAEHPLLLDTGANLSILKPRFAAAHPDLTAVNSGKTRKRAGAGGAEEVSVAHYAKLPSVIGGEAIDLTNVSVEVAAKPEPDQDFGVLGNDILKLFGSFTIDFDRMTFEVTPK
ncbi:MAG TPA: pepsin/retropepsin-like aspartic protease family protein [Allosphingosinicella sp.]|uniref:pepsin/retropepsin-like aspartic protease family protein n=1 Tax=Allosphingosinicella sp. TaxID=2823234 RepID=UPI002EDB9609